MLRKLLALSLLLSFSNAFADSIDLNLHDKAIRATYTTAVKSTQGLDADFGYLYTDTKGSVAHAGLQVSGGNWSKAGTFDIGLGGRLILASVPGTDMGGLALGGRVRFSPMERVGLSGSLFYAPDIISFGNGKRYLETTVQVDYQVLPQAFVYIGQRLVRFDANSGGERKIDDQGHIGMRLTF